MDALPIDIQSLIWRTFYTTHVIPRLPTQHELWTKSYRKLYGEIWPPARRLANGRLCVCGYCAPALPPPAYQLDFRSEY